MLNSTESKTNDIFISYQIVFPAITVCNQNRVNCEALKTVVENCKAYNDGEPNCNAEYEKIVPENVTICSKCMDNSTMLIIDHLYNVSGCEAKILENEKKVQKSLGKL